MIKSFKHKGLKVFFTEDNKKYLNLKDIVKISRILDRLDSSTCIKDMNIIGWNLHPLIGNRNGVWSVSVSKNWRITFKFENGDVYLVDYEDYH